MYKPLCKVVKDFSNRVYIFSKKHLLICLIVFLSVISFLIYRQFLLFNKLFVYTDIGRDMYAQTLPALSYVSEYIKTGYPWWSFSIGIGQNMYASGFSFGDPFISIALLLGKNALPYSLGYLQALKPVIAGIFFYNYLRKLELRDGVCFIVAILYAFCGHIIGRGSWVSYPNEVVWVAFVLYAVERFLTDSDYLVLPISVCIFCLSLKGYQALVYIIYFFIYTLFRYFSNRQKGFGSFIQFLYKYIGVFTLGVALSSVIVLPSILYGFGSARIAGEYSLVDTLRSSPVLSIINGESFFTTIFRTLTIDGLGTGNAYTGTGNYLESPLFYCGILTVLLLPQSIVIRDKRRKIVIFIMLTLTIFYMLFPYVRYTVNGFVSEYYRRSSFIFVVVMLYSTANALDIITSNKRINLPILIASLLIIAVLCFFGYQQRAFYGFSFDKYIIICTGVFIICYSIVALLYSNSVITTRIFFVIITGLVSLEVGLFGYNSVNDRSVLSNEFFTERVGYNDYTNEAVDWIKSRDNSAFYRTETKYSSELCSSMYQHYYGTKSYYTQPKTYLAFLNLVDAGIPAKVDPQNLDGSLNVVFSYNERYMLNTLLGMKYILSRSNDMSMEGYQLVGNQGDVFIYENTNALSIGVTFGKYLYKSELTDIDNIVKDAALLQSVVLEDGAAHEKGIQKLDLTQIISQLTIQPVDLTGVQVFNAQIKTQTKSTITLHSINDDPYIVFPMQNQQQMAELVFTIDSISDTNGQLFWKNNSDEFCEANSVVFNVLRGKHQYSIFIADTNFETLRLDFACSTGDYLIGELSLKTLPVDLYDTKITERKNEAFEISEFSQNNITGQVDTEDGGIVLFSILHDKGWSAKVDGKNARIITVDAGLLGIVVDPGKHKIELSYVPPYFYTGCVITTAAVIIYIVLIMAIRLNIINKSVKTRFRV